MSGYIKQLEEQNEALQKKCATLEYAQNFAPMWEPNGVAQSYGIEGLYEIANVLKNVGRDGVTWFVLFNKNIAFLPVNVVGVEPCFASEQEAKQYVEKLVSLQWCTSATYN